MDYTAIFQGGGIKGLAYIGALYALEENGFKPKRAAGTSMGAILAGLVASGYNAYELSYAMNEIDFATLIKKDSKKIKNIITEKGLHSTCYINEKISYLLKQKNIYTFGDLKTDNDYKLKVIGTNASNYQQIIFPNDLVFYNINPNYFYVSDAIVMSATYPGYFKPLKLQNNFILDGGLCNNFPYNVYQYLPNDLVIGFQILEKNYKNIPDNINIAKINTSGFKILDFKISPKGKQELFMKGYQAGQKIAGQIIQKYNI